MVTHPTFDNVILFVIGLQSLCMTLESPATKDKNGFMQQILELSNFVFVGIFTLEIIFKLIAFGFCSGPDAYIRNGWNRFAKSYHD